MSEIQSFQRTSTRSQLFIFSNVLLSKIPSTYLGLELEEVKKTVAMSCMLIPESKVQIPEYYVFPFQKRSNFGNTRIAFVVVFPRSRDSAWKSAILLHRPKKRRSLNGKSLTRPGTNDSMSTKKVHTINWFTLWTLLKREMDSILAADLKKFRSSIAHGFRADEAKDS